MTRMTATQMLAVADGVALNSGNESCYYCGGACDRSIPVRIADTFTGRSTVARPDGSYECAGCLHAMGNLKRLTGYEKPQKMWQFSHIITADSVRRVRGGNAPLVSACSSPPAVPFVISVAVSLKKHLLYRAPVNLDGRSIRVQFEEGVVVFSPAAFPVRLELCRRMAAACGKPALAAGVSARMAVALADYYDDWEPLLQEWQGVGGEPLTLLCLYFCEKKEVCGGKYPRTAARVARRGGVAKKAGRTDGPGLFDGQRG